MQYRMALLQPILSREAHVADRPSRGCVQRAQTGAAYPDFVFVEDEGIRRALRNQVGDFMALAYTRRDRDTHGLAAAILRGIASESRGTDCVALGEGKEDLAHPMDRKSLDPADRREELR